MKILLDMNMSPRRVSYLESVGFETVHWSTVGQALAKDPEIMAYARQNHYVVLTEDLDFGKLLAMTNCESPSVIQIRTQFSSPEKIGLRMVALLQKFKEELEQGALITIDPQGHRQRILPFRSIQ